MINETLLEKARKAIYKSVKSFGIGLSLVFYPTKIIAYYH